MSAARVLALAGLLCLAAAAPAGAAGTLALDPEGGVIVAMGGVVARYDDAGVLDPAFGIDGYRRAAGEGLLRRPDGRIVTYFISRQDFCCDLRDVWQHLPDGSLDEAFGEGGRLKLDLRGAAAALAPEGEIVIADSAFPGVRVRRIEPDGTLDPDFAAAAGLPGFSLDVNDVHVTAEGILVGREDSLMRFTPGGRLDENFADGGVLRVQSHRSLVTEAGINLLGIDREAPEPAWVVTRLHADGTRDADWGDDGRRRLGQVPYGGIFCCATGGALAEGPAGTVLAATTVQAPSGQPGIAVTRLTSAGDIDAGYGSGGSTVFELGFQDTVRDIVALPSGAAVVADHIRDANGDHPQLGLARLTASGTLDPSFSGDGKLATAFDVSGPQVRIDASDIAGTSATFAFSSSGDAVGFRCTLSAAAPVSCESPARYDGLPDGRHTFKVEAFDRRGNVSEAGYVMDYWVVNARPPDTSLALTPAPVERRAAVRFDLAADEPVRAFNCSLDGVALGGCPAIVRVRVAEGEHVFEAQAVDVWGAADPTPVVYRFRVDFTAPDTRIDAGPPAVTRERSAAVAFSSSSDAAAAFECRVDGRAWAACASPLQLADLQPGVHSVQVRAVDTVGNADAAGAERLWQVEEQPGEAGSPPALEVLAARRTVHRAGGPRGLLARLRVHNPLGRRGTIRLCATYPRGWRAGAAARRVCPLRSVAAGGEETFRLRGRPPRRPRAGTLRYSIAFPGLAAQRGTSRWVARR